MGHACVVHNNRLWVLGGFGEDGNALKEVWSCGVNGDWKQHTTALWPARCMHAAIAYDGAHKNIVLLFRSGKYDVETWTWNGQNWTPQHPVALPLTAVAYSMAWDEATGQVVLFDIVSVVAPQTWIWTGSNWERKA